MGNDPAAGADDAMARLLARCAGDDESAWLELFTLCHPRAQRVALAPPFRFSDADADDVAQETLLELHRSIRTVRNPLAFSGIVAHNKCVDRLRRRKPLLSAAEVEELPTRDEPDGLPPGWEASPALTRLRGILAETDERWARILFLRYFEELEYARIAERLGLPANQMGMLITRALAALRDEIKRHEGLWAELGGLFEGR
jgi:RNA polymerase sigma-70 factor (ECF subfamily)